MSLLQISPALALLVALSLGACKQEPEQATSGDPTAGTTGSDSTATQEGSPDASASLPGESIYQLQSQWRDQSGAAQSLDAFRGKVTVQAMIFTNCGYACPRILSDLKGIEAKVSSDTLQEVQWLLVTMDADRDTPEVLLAYAKKNELDLARWTLLHGDASAVRELGAVTGVRYKQGLDGDFSHSNLINVLDRDGRIFQQLEGLGIDSGDGAQAIANALAKSTTGTSPTVSSADRNQ